MRGLVLALCLFVAGLLLPAVLLALWFLVAGSHWGFLVVLLFIYSLPAILTAFPSPVTLLFTGFLVLGLFLTLKTRSKTVALLMGFTAGLPLAVMVSALLAIVGCATSGC